MFSPKHPLQQSQEFVEDAEKKLSTFSIQSQVQQAQISAMTHAGIQLAKSRQKHERKHELAVAYNMFRESAVGFTQSMSALGNMPQLDGEDGATDQKQQPKAKLELPNNNKANPTTKLDSNKSQPSLDEEAVIDAILRDDFVLNKFAAEVVSLQKRKENLVLDDTSQQAYDKWCKEIIVATLDGSDMLPVMHTPAIPTYAKWKAIRDQSNQKKISNIDTEIKAAITNYAHERQRARQGMYDYNIARERQLNFYQNLGAGDHEIEYQMSKFPERFDYLVLMHKKYAVEYAKSTSHPQAKNFIKLISGQKIDDADWNNYKIYNTNPLPEEFFALSISVTKELAEKINQQSTVKDNPWLRMTIKTGKVAAGKIKHKGVSIGGSLLFDAADSWVGNIDDERMLKIEQRLDEALEIQRQIIPRVAGGDSGKLRNMYTVLNATLEAIASDTDVSYKLQKTLNAKIESNKIAMLEQLDNIDTNTSVKQTNRFR